MKNSQSEYIFGFLRNGKYYTSYCDKTIFDKNGCIKPPTTWVNNFWGNNSLFLEIEIGDVVDMFSNIYKVMSINTIEDEEDRIKIKLMMTTRE